MVERQCGACRIPLCSCNTTDEIVVLGNIRSYRCQFKLYRTSIYKYSLSILHGIYKNLAVEYTLNGTTSEGLYGESIEYGCLDSTIISEVDFSLFCTFL